MGDFNPRGGEDGILVGRVDEGIGDGVKVDPRKEGQACLDPVQVHDVVLVEPEGGSNREQGLSRQLVEIGFSL